MSRLIEIENKLISIAPSTFERLIEEFFSAKGYKVHSQRVEGKDRTRKGKPDLYIVDDNQYIFLECTVEKNFKKLKKDLSDCFILSKTGIEPKKIKEIKLCYNFKLSNITEDRELRTIAADNNCKLDLVDLSIISNELNQHYPYLVKDYFDIQYDSEQILPPSQFINIYTKNKLTVGFEKEFMFREDELKKAFEILENHDLLIVRGEAGSGKTRFALQLQELYTNIHRDFEKYVIMNKGIDGITVYEDSKRYFLRSKKYIIIIDDGNRGIPNLRAILLLLDKDDINIKIIITVRDYAYSQIQSIANEYSTSPPISITNFNHTQLETILKQYNIRWEAFDTIYRATKGNPRLAIMCTKFALEKNNLSVLNNISQIFDKYYGNLFKDIVSEEPINLKVLGLVAYLRVIDKNNSELFEKIQNTFQIDKTTFWDVVYKFHNLEILDMYDSQYVKFSDQVFLNYVFYKVFFDLEILDYGLLLLNFSNNFKSENLFLDTLNPTISNFGVDNIKAKLEKHFDFWKVTHAHNKDILLQIFKFFWFVRPTVILVYISEFVNSLPKENIKLINFHIEEKKVGNFDYNDFKDEYIEILQQYHQSYTHFTRSLEIIFEYLYKKPSYYKYIIKYFQNVLIYDKNSHLENYYFQNSLFSFLISRSKDKKLGYIFKNVVFEISNNFLLTSRHVDYMSDFMTVSMIEMPLYLSDSIKELRKNIFQFVFSFYKTKTDKETVLKFFNKYTHSHENKFQKKIYEYDTSYTIPFIESNLNSESFYECRLIYEYIDLLNKRVNCKTYNYLRDKFTNETFELYKSLRWDERRELKMKSNDFNEFLTKKFNNKFKNYDYKAYLKLLDMFKVILSFTQAHIEYQIKGSILIILSNLAILNIELSLKVIAKIISTQNSIGVIPYLSFAIIFKNDKKIVKQFYNLINNNKFELRNTWKEYFFKMLPSVHLDEFYLKEYYNFLALRENKNINFFDFDFLKNYKVLEPDVIGKTFSIIIKRFKEKDFKIDLDYLFLNFDESKDIMDYFDLNIKVLKQIYFYYITKDPHHHTGSIFNYLIKKDPDFVFEYFKYRYKDKTYVSDYDEKGSFKVLWESTDYEKTIDKALAYFKKNTKYYIGREYYNILFKDMTYMGKVENYLKKYIKENINNLDKLNFIFHIIADQYADKRIELLKYLFQVNPKFKNLEKLYIDPSGWGYSGSPIPVFEKRKRFWETLKEMLSDINQNEYLSLAEEQIRLWDMRIKNEFKKEFTQEERF